MAATLPNPALESKAITAALPTAVADDASTGAVLSLSNEPGNDVGGVVFNYDSNGASTSNATYGVWIKTTQTAQQMLIQAAYAQPYIYIENNQIGVRWDDAGGPWLSTDTRPISDGNWHHIMVVFNNGAVTFFKDGVSTSDSFTVTTLTNASQPLNLGGNYDGIPGFIGEIWNAQVWNTVLPFDTSFYQVSNTYSANFPTGLVFLSSFDARSNTATNLISGQPATSMIDAQIITDALPEFASTPNSYTLTYSTKLSEDYIHSAAIFASAGASQPLATFLNSSGQSEVLLIYPENSATELCHLMREPLSNTGWNFVGVGAQVQSIAAANSNSLAILSIDENIWVSNAGHWNPISGITGGQPSISALTDGTIFATTDQGNGQYVLYQYDVVADNLTLIGDIPYAAPPVGSAGNLYTLDEEGEVLYNTSNPVNAGTNWQTIDTQDLNDDVPQSVFVTADNSLYVLCNSANNTFTAYIQDSDGFDWDLLAVPAGMFAIAPQSNGAFYVLANNSGIITLYTCDGNGGNTPVAQPTGRSLRAISVGAADGNLWAVDSFGAIWCQRNGSWVRIIQPAGLSGATGGNQLTEVVTGQHALGAQYAFYIMNGDLQYSSFQETSGVYGGYWTQPIQVASGISNIGVVNDPVTASNLIVYGVNSSGQLVIVQDKNGTWTANSYAMSDSLTNVRPVFNTYNAYWLVYAIISGAMNASVGQLNGPQKQLTPLAGSPKFVTMVPMSTNPQGIDWPIGAMAIDTQGQLWMTQITTTKGDMFTFQFVQLSGTAVGSAIGNITRAVATFASEYDGIRVYATDDSDMLWILRLSSYDSCSGIFTWSEWHPLGNDCQILGTGCTLPVPSQKNLPPVDLFSLDANSQVNVLSENATTGALTDLLMLKPAGTNEDATYITRYLTEVAIADNNGLPQPSFQLSVTSDVAVGIWVGQNTFTISPSIPQTFNTDGTGKLTFSFFAADLHTPTFSFSAPSLNNPPSIYPAQEVQAYLAGSTTALPAQPRFDTQGQTLAGAQMKTVPEWDSTQTTSFVTSQYTGNAPTAAGVIAQIAGTPTTSQPSGQWSVDDSYSGGLVGGSSFWHDLCNFPHDIDHAIKKAALTVSHIEMDAENAILKVTMALANDVTQVLNLVIHTVEDIVSAVKTVFRYIGRAVDDAIHWLKSLFDWTDVLNTKNILETLLNAMMSRLEENLNPNSQVYAGAIFDKYFQDLVSYINQGFTNAESAFSSTPSINDVASSQTYPTQAASMGPDALHPTNMSNAQSANSTHCNFVHNHAVNYGSQGGSFPAADMGVGVLQTLFDKIDASINQEPYKTAQMESITNLKGLTAKNFADVVIFDIINAIQKTVMLLLDVVQNLVDEIISLMGSALSTMQSMFNQPINIPVISWIYKKISDHSLTMLDLFCLTTALPATLLYKLTFGMPDLKPPFTSEEAQNIVQKYTDPSQFPWPTIATPSSGVSAERAELGSFPFLADAGLIPAIGFLYMVVDMANDATAYKNYKITPFPEALPPDPVDTFLSQWGCFTSLAWQMFTANYTVMQNGSHSPADAITMAYWAYGFVPMGINWAFTFGAPNKRIATFSRAYGVPILCTCSLIQLALGVATSVTQALHKTDPDGTYNAFYWAQNVVAPIPSVLKPLLTIQGELAQEVAACVLVGLDMGCDAASCALAFCQDL
jgi:Concanavalin A-like lectin/glucanases superfamily